MSSVSPLRISPTDQVHHAPNLARFAIAGWGTALPERVVTNEDFAEHLDTSDEWITARTGIRERRIAAAGESTGSLAVAAARRALEAAGIDARQVDTVLVATSTPEQPIPSTASWVTARMGITAGAFDLNAACAGFVYGLAVAGSLLEAGVGRTILLIGADTMSRFVDPNDRSTAVLFGDGAGAMVLVPETVHAAGRSSAAAPGGLVACDLVGDPDAFDLLVVPAGGSARPSSIDTVRAGDHYLYMDGREVFRRAVRAVTDSILRTLDRAGCTPDDVDLFIPHQANARIIDAVIDRVGLKPDRAVQTVDRHGNTSSASVPLAVGEITQDQHIEDGSLILTSGFGAGLAVGTGLLRWRTSRPTTARPAEAPLA